VQISMLVFNIQNGSSKIIRAVPATGNFPRAGVTTKVFELLP
jgi:hypothetical protein